METVCCEKFKRYYYELLNDIYPQPQEEEQDQHYRRAQIVIDRWTPMIKPYNVLDIGCGEGFCQEIFAKHKVMQYTGVSLGKDVDVGLHLGRNVMDMDFNFLDFPDNTFELVFARHALEHSPMPIISLMEWHRVAIRWMIVVTPRPKDKTIGFIGRNHYSVVESHTQLRWWLRRAGWIVRDKYHSDDEFRYLCEKLPRVGYEGWEEPPLSAATHNADRDDLV